MAGHELVLDASMTLSWCFGDQRTQAAAAVLDRVVDAGARVPGLWHLEVANALQMAVHRSRVSSEWRDDTLKDSGALAITVDPETDYCAWTKTLKLAEQWQLTVHEAAYLELALREGLPLASRNETLCKAAQGAGVEVLGQ